MCGVGQCSVCCVVIRFFFKQKTAYEMRFSDCSSYVFSSDLPRPQSPALRLHFPQVRRRDAPCALFGGGAVDDGAVQGVGAGIAADAAIAGGGGDADRDLDVALAGAGVHSARLTQGGDYLSGIGEAVGERSEEHPSELQSLM